MTIEEWIEDLDKFAQRHSRKISTLESNCADLENKVGEREGTIELNLESIGNIQKALSQLVGEQRKMNDAINIGAANYIEVKEKIENITYFLKKKFPGEFL